MSKGWLEEIKELWEQDNQYCDPSTYERLIEQSELGISQQEQFHDYQTQNLRLQERVRELERNLCQDHRQEVLEGMYEQNKRYREIMEKSKKAIQANLQRWNYKDEEKLYEAYKELEKALEGKE